MITVRGRQLIIPESDKQIGTQYDNNSETRRFRLDRLTLGGIDLANLDYRLDLRYADKKLDTSILSKEVTEEAITLVWTVPASCVQQVGTVWVALRGSDDFGTVKWASNQGALYVGQTIDTPAGVETGLTELEELEKRIEQKESQMDANEQARQDAEAVRVQNEKKRLDNEALWQEQAERAIKEAQDTLTAANAAKDAAAGSASAAASSKGAAEAAASTAADKAGDAAASASAAATSKSAAETAASTATAKAGDAAASASAAATSKSAAETAASTATAKAGDAAATSKSAAETAASTATAKAGDAADSAAEAASSKTAAENAAKRAEDAAAGIEGVGEFDGTASTVSAIDSQGLATETPGGESTVQDLLDALASKIKDELVTNDALLEKLALYVVKSSIVNNGLTAADVEGMVLDARQANENIEGTLASKILKLNSDLQNTAKTNIENVFSMNQRLESSAFGNSDTNAALFITARTDQNQYARPSIRFDCYGTGGAVLYLDTDMQLKLNIAGVHKVIQVQ